MAYHLISEEKHTAPDYNRVLRTGHRKTSLGERYTVDEPGSSKEPNGLMIERTFKTWRCGHCRALAVCDQPPAKCGKCHL